MAADERVDHPTQVLRFVARFDRGEYWLAHEELEELWQHDRRDFFKGMIQIAAGFLHIERQNWRGAGRLLRTALEYLEPYPATYEGFDVEGIRESVSAALAQVENMAENREADAAQIRPPSMAASFDGHLPDGIVADEELPYRVRRYEDGYRP